MSLFKISPSLILLVLLPSLQTSAQFQNPPGIDWKKIDTEHFEVIFPPEITRDAQRVANTLEHVYEPVAKTLAEKPGRISILLSNRTAQANGYVTLAPRYSEWFATPPPYSLVGTSEWFNLLATHETRHIVQFDKLNSGFTRGAYYFFGESAWSFLTNWSVPAWVWEGDAVGVETALTNGGRGRMPEFDMGVRALLLSDKRYSYYKAYLQSYNDWYPDHYTLGYLITTHAKRMYGAEKFATVLERSANWSFCPCAYSAMSNSETDKTSVEMYESAMDELTILWKNQLDGLSFTEARRVNAEKKSGWTNYLFPQYADDGSIIAQKWGMNDVFSFVTIHSDGREEELCVTASYGNPMRVNGEKILWSDSEPDVRWAKQDYTRILIHDVKTQSTRTIASERKLFSPALSPDRKTIAAVAFDESRNCAIAFLNAESGEETSRVPNPVNDFFQTPSWTSDGKHILIVRVTQDRGKAISLVDARTGEMRDLLPPSFENVSLPALHGRYLLYNSPYSGIDNIYALDLETNRRYQVTSRKFGAFHPAVSPDGKKLIFSDYTIDGYDVAEMPFDPSSWKRIEDVQDRSSKYYEPLIAQESRGNIMKDIPTRQYGVEDYSALSNLINVHSWSIFPALTGEAIGLSLNSTNIMNTFGASVGFDYNWNERNGSASVSMQYQGLFPLFNVSADYGLRSATYTTSDDELKTYSWREKGFHFGIQLPFNLSRGIYSTFLSLGAELSYRRVWDKTRIDEDITDGVIAPARYELQFQRGYQWIRDVAPRYGQFLSLTYTHSPLKSDNKGSLLAAQAHLFFPGLFDNHSLWFKAGFEKQTAEQYIFPGEMLFTRGYDSRFHKTLYQFSANYALPLWYPDFHIWSLLNFKRIKVNGFYDFGEGKDGSATLRYQSTGGELVIDFNIFSLPFEVETGVRYSYLLTEKKWITQAIAGFGF